MLKLTITLVAGALALASFPAGAMDLPEYGSKNFSPTGDTPAYFANEAAPVSARTADTTERDWSAVDAMAPSRPLGSAHSHGARQHGRHIAIRGSGRYAAGKSSGTARSGYLASPAKAVHLRATAARPSTAATARTAAAKAVGTKHGRPAARHASAAPNDRDS